MDDEQNPSDFAKEFDLDELIPEFIIGETYEYKYKSRRNLKYWAQRQLEEYYNMSEEEQKQFEEERNKEGRYTKKQLEEIANSENVEVPEKFGSGDLKARPIEEYRKILEAMMENFDPEQGRPVWTRTVNTLKDHDVSITPAVLKRYWTAVREKDAYNLVKNKLYWNIFEGMEDSVEALIDHVIDRVGTEGGKYDDIEKRVNALVKIVEMVKGLPYDQPQRVQVQEDKTETKRIQLVEYDEDQVEEIKDQGYVDVDDD